MDEFSNLRQGGMSVHNYSLMFTKLSSYASSFVSNARNEMIYFLKGVPDDMVEECRSAMFHENKLISSQIVRIERPRRPSLLKVVPQRGGLKFKISRDSRLCSPIKSLQNFPRLMMIGCITLSLKGQ